MSNFEVMRLTPKINNMITKELTASTSTLMPKYKPKLEKTKLPIHDIDHWLACASKWIAILEKWEVEGDLIQKLHRLGTTGRAIDKEGIVVVEKMVNILTNEIRPLKLLLFNFSNDLQSMEQFPDAAKKKIEVQRIKLHRIGEKYDEIKHKMLLKIIEQYPISIV